MRGWHFTAVVAVVLGCAVPGGLDSCSIAPPSAVFATKQRPADLRNQFLKGRVGVLQRSYEQRYLIGAYRMLSGVPLTEAEVASLYPEPVPIQGYSDVQPGSDLWVKARAAVEGLAPAPAVDTYKSMPLKGEIYSFENCHEDAFRKAAQTLSELSAKWGGRDLRTLDWVRGQDQVFTNCSAKEAAIPPEVEAGADPLLAAHRHYQIAAALFYAGQYRKAAEAFRRISDEQDSPWRSWATYLTARALLRAAMFDSDQEAVGESKDGLLASLQDPGQRDRHDDCRRLLHLWQLREEPRARLAELSSQLIRPNTEDIKQSVVDFLFVVNHWQGEIDEDTSELAAWMVVMSPRVSAGAGGRAVVWWRKTRNPAWLIAALANADETDLDELLEAARQIPARAPAYESVAYYATSRELARGHNDEARRWADRALGTNLQRSSRNLILALRTRLARDWSEFLRYGLRRPEPKMEDFEGDEVEAERTPLPSGTAPVFDMDVINDFNAHLPLSLWVNASRNPIVPEHMQVRIAQSGWARAVVLGREEEARKLMQRVVDLQPAAESARGFLGARDASESHFAALYVILRGPELRPELSAAELRTVDLAQTHYVGGCWVYGQEQTTTMNSSFLTEDQRAAGEAESKKIHDTPPWNATYLARETLEWAHKRPDDPRVPEALHRAVMASRYRCADPQTGKYSQQAFALLHQQYPGSPWAARTKYWYK